MKLRIIEKNGLYFPQYRFCFIWWNFSKGLMNVYYGDFTSAKNFCNDRLADNKTRYTSNKISVVWESD